MLLVNGFPRRGRVECLSPAESTIREAIITVAVGADPRLTVAVVLLMQAQSKVADYVDEQTQTMPNV